MHSQLCEEVGLKTVEMTGCTVKNAVELLDAPSRNNFLVMKKYNRHVEILFLYIHVLFFNSIIE